MTLDDLSKRIDELETQIAASEASRSILEYSYGVRFEQHIRTLRDELRSAHQQLRQIYALSDLV